MRIVYNAYDGRYADNPRALHRALVARGDDHEHLWLAHPARGPFPAGVATVPIASPAATEALESADVVVSNCHLTLDPWRKAPGAVYLQTWHGTPLKRIHRDAALVPPEAEMAVLDADIARWDLLVTPSAEGTGLLRTAFRYDGEVLQTGYPRNDVLAAPGAGERRAAVRRRLGIAEGTTAVLYAPTYRDDQADAGAGPLPLGLDVAALADDLGGDHVLLLRLHYFVSHRLALTGAARADPRVLDVSALPEASDLYLAADVLVTDYSSAVFDFAVTGRPVLLYAYDLAHYRDGLRGFYLDLETEGPGPVLTDQGQLTRALRDLPAVAAAHAERYRRFRERFCPLDDGRATERVLARLWPVA